MLGLFRKNFSMTYVYGEHIMHPLLKFNYYLDFDMSGGKLEVAVCRLITSKNKNIICTLCDFETMDAVFQKIKFENTNIKEGCLIKFNITRFRKYSVITIEIDSQKCKIFIRSSYVLNVKNKMRSFTLNKMEF